MNRFESSAVSRQHPAPFVDGAREVRCPKKLDGVIAAARCLAEQAQGCTCARAVAPDIRAELVEATTPKMDPGTEARNQRIREAVAQGDSLSTIAAREGLSKSHVGAIASTPAGQVVRGGPR